MNRSPSELIAEIVVTVFIVLAVVLGLMRLAGQI